MEQAIRPKKYIKCRVVGHEKMDLGSVCLQCKPTVLVCNYCKEVSHSNHIIESIDECMSRIKSLKFDLPTLSGICNNFLISIRSKETGAKQLIKTFRESMNITLDDLNKDIEKYFQDIDNKLRNVLKRFRQNVEKLSSSREEQNFQKAKAQIQNFGICQRDKGFQDHINNMSQDLERYESRIKTILDNANEKIGFFVKEVKVISKANQTMFQVKQYMNLPLWDQINKHPQIKIVKTNIQRTSRQMTPISVGILMKFKERNIQEVYKWAIKICRFKGWINIGICSQEALQKNRFARMNWKDLVGHGSYIINSDGSVFSNHEENISKSSFAFNFKQGDIIEIDYELKKRNIIFSKKLSSSQKYNMKIQKSKQKYLPCVFLWQVGDAVEVVPREL